MKASWHFLSVTWRLQTLVDVFIWGNSLLHKNIFIFLVKFLLLRGLCQNGWLRYVFMTYLISYECIFAAKKCLNVKQAQGSFYGNWGSILVGWALAFSVVHVKWGSLDCYSGHGLHGARKQFLRNLISKLPDMVWMRPKKVFSHITSDIYHLKSFFKEILNLIIELPT